MTSGPIHKKVKHAGGRPASPNGLSDCLSRIDARVSAELIGHHWPNPKFQNDPVGFAEQILGVKLWSFQIEFLEAIRDNRRVSVSGGRKIGKDFAVAIAALWWYCSHPKSRVVILAPTVRQIDEILWREVLQRLDASGRCLACKAQEPEGEAPCPHSAIIPHERIGMRASTGLKSDDFRQIIGFTAMKEGGIRGLSGDNILAIIDEASDVQDQFQKALWGNLAASNCKIVYISNPTRSVGFFHRSHHTERELYYTIQVDTRTNPNAMSGQPVFPGLASREWIEESKIAWGEGSLAWLANVEGKFPTTEAGQLFSLEDVRAASSPERLEATSCSGRLCMGIDVAGEKDSGDETVIFCRRGNMILDMVAQRGMTPDAITMAAVGILDRFRDPSTDYIDGFYPLIVIDRDGATGARVYDAVNAYRRRDEKTLHEFKLVGFQGGNPSPNPGIAQIYRCQRDVMFAGMHQWITEGGCIPQDAKMEGELLSLRWVERDNRGRSQLVRKNELREILGRSPDRCDALALSTWGFHSSANEDAQPAPNQDRAPSVGHRYIEQASDYESLDWAYKRPW